MLNNQLKHQRGVSLVELMVGIVVGLIVLLGMSSVYINAARGSRTSTAANQLNQDMRAAMDIMVNDMRRAGFWNATTTGINPFTAGATNIRITGSCILYSYDATYVNTAAGVTAGADIFGYRLNGGVLQVLDPAAGLNSTAAAGCTTDGNWQNLTDGRAMNVSSLTFNTGGSKCIAYGLSTYVPTNPATFTTWTTNAGTTGPACNELVNNNLPTASAAASAVATNAFVETRQIRITMVANSLTDATLGARTLNETVLVRNNRVINP